MAKYYAIRKGRKCNVIVETWDECQELITGYSGMEYRSFKHEEDAKAYLIGKLNESAKNPPTATITVYCEASCEFMSNGLCTSKKIKHDNNGQCKNY